MNPFREAAAAHAAAVDSVYGERLQLRPQTNGDDLTNGGDDAARAALARIVIGSVTRRPLVTGRSGHGAQGADNARVVTAQWLVGFDALLGLGLRAGDLVVRLDEPGAPTLRLAAPEPIAGRILYPADQVS